MRTTIDKAGRLVLPKELRDRIGLTAGEVDIEIDGTALRIAPVASDVLVEQGGRWVVPAGGEPVSDATVRALRDGDQR